jgi:hypothetical protein
MIISTRRIILTYVIQYLYVLFISWVFHEYSASHKINFELLELRSTPIVGTYTYNTIMYHTTKIYNYKEELLFYKLNK